jgi:hypothetical protein
MRLCKINGNNGYEDNNVTTDTSPYFSTNELANTIRNTMQALQKHGTGIGRLAMPCNTNVLKPMY